MDILLVLTKDVFYRNFAHKDFLNPLKSEFKLNIALCDDVNDHRNIADHYYSEYSQNARIHKILINAALVRHRKKTSSFEFRIRRRLTPSWRTINSPIALRSFVRDYIRFLGYKLITFNSLIYDSACKLLENCFSRNQAIENLIASSNPKLVLIPTNGAHEKEFEIERLLHSKGIPYISLVDNWDNLSSKTIVRYHASKYMVWGPQSVLHGNVIQGISIDKLVAAGSCRFEFYKNCHNPKEQNEKYVLFVGTTVEFDEYAALKELDRVISENELGLHILYRPHPWRESSRFPNLSSLVNVRIDPGVETQYQAGSTKPSFQPELEAYAKVIQGALFVIGGLTSMMIEAQLLKRRFLALAYEESGNGLSPRQIFLGYTHFREIPLLKNLSFVHDFRHLEREFLETLSKHENFEDDDFLRYFVTFDQKPYVDRVIEESRALINKVDRT